MNEIEKMYENADIKTLKDCKHYLRGDGNWCNDTCDIEKGQGIYCDICYLGDNHDKNDTDRLKCPYCEVENFGYPPFTAEKQLELIKWLARKSHITIGLGLPWGQYDDDWWTVTSKNGGLGTNAYEFEEALASFVNSKWQSLTDAERKQIKEILE